MRGKQSDTELRRKFDIKCRIRTEANRLMKVQNDKTIKERRSIDLSIYHEDFRVNFNTVFRMIGQRFYFNESKF